MAKKLGYGKREETSKIHEEIVNEFEEMKIKNNGKNIKISLDFLAKKYGYSCGQAVRNMINNFQKNKMKHHNVLRKLEILNSEFDRDGLEMLLGSLWLSNGNTLEVREDEVIYCDADFEPIETLNAEESAFWFNHAQSLFYSTDEYKSAKNREKEEEYLNSLDELADLRHQQFREEN